jgi:hypothetical protein
MRSTRPSEKSTFSGNSHANWIMQLFLLYLFVVELVQMPQNLPILNNTEDRLIACTW